jgi:hypothetical protein
MVASAGLSRSVADIDQYIKFVSDTISEYNKRRLRRATDRIIDLRKYRPQVIAAYNIAMREFIEERFGKLAEIGTSPKWESMKSRGWPVRVTKGGGKKASIPENAQAFGLASEFLISNIFDALLSDKGISPGFQMIVKIAANNIPDWKFEVRTDNFYRIPFKGRRVPYPVFLNDLLEGKLPYVDKEGKPPLRDVYNAYGQFSLGLLGMTPAESEAIDVNAKQVFLRIIAAARSTVGRRS